MPEISRFFGIIIKMPVDDHAPPHFHAYHAGRVAAVEIRSRRLMAGSLHPRALRQVREWTCLHEAELLADWDLIRRGAPPVRITPLE